jgi:hypothetical protein
MWDVLVECSGSQGEVLLRHTLWMATHISSHVRGHVCSACYDSIPLRIAHWELSCLHGHLWGRSFEAVRPISWLSTSAWLSGLLQELGGALVSFVAQQALTQVTQVIAEAAVCCPNKHLSPEGTATHVHLCW